MANPAPLHHTEGEKERARWEMFRDDCARGLQPGNPYRRGNDYGKAGAEYPTTLFRAEQIPPGLPGAGKYAVACPDPRRLGYRDEDEWGEARREAQRFNESCNRIVHSEDQKLLALGQGWRETHKEALTLAEAGRVDRGDITAAQNHADQHMSGKALAEKDKKVSEHFGHMPEVPADPIKRRVKKEKAGKSAAA